MANKITISGLFVFAISGIFSSAVLAIEDYTRPFCNLPVPSRPTVDKVLAIDDTHFVADKADLVSEDISILTGNAEITRGEQQVRADVIEYDQQKDIATLKNNVHYWDNKLFLRSDDALITFNEDLGEFTNAEYNLLDKNTRGSAEKILVKQDSYNDMTQAQYTSCVPGDEFWSLSAKSVLLDYERDRGTAKHAIIKLKDIPIFYSPFLSFPLSDERKTGFLKPSYGSTKRHGFELLTPYYWNIRPNIDATLTPRLLTDSGVMLMGEYRFLTPNSQGAINAELLPSDKRRDDDNRYLFKLKFDHVVGNNQFNVDYNKASDSFYFEDFGNQLSITSTRFLEQTARFTHSDSNWNVSALVQNYQSIDRSNTAQPYKRLPYVSFNYNLPRQENAFNYGVSGHSAYFTRNVNNSLDGLRFDINSYISYRAATQAGFIEPKLKLHYTQYSLDSHNEFDSNPNRVTPIFSLHGGLFLERDIEVFNTALLQTLEPQFYYLYVPKQNQSDIPIFDTGQHTFSFDALFRDNRFSNVDRIGDANRFAVSVTSNHISRSSGRNLAAIKIGQIFHLNDRRVTLNDVAETDTLSPFVSQISISPLKSLQLLNDFQWHWNDKTIQKLTTAVRYSPAVGKILNMAYRDHSNVEQSSISFRWPIINTNWSAVSHWTYNITQKKSLETFAGFEYNSCCWALRAVARRFLTNIEEQYDTGFFLQFELKGLTGIGRETERFLQQNIPGY